MASRKHFSVRWVIRDPSSTLADPLRQFTAEKLKMGTFSRGIRPTPPLLLAGGGVPKCMKCLTYALFWSFREFHCLPKWELWTTSPPGVQRKNDFPRSQAPAWERPIAKLRFARDQVKHSVTVG